MLKRLFRKRPIYSFRQRLLDESVFRAVILGHQKKIIDGLDPSRVCPYTLRVLRDRLEYHRHIAKKVTSYYQQMRRK